jgi:hypothetical protein
LVNASLITVPFAWEKLQQHLRGPVRSGLDDSADPIYVSASMVGALIAIDGPIAKAPGL